MHCISRAGMPFNKGVDRQLHQPVFQQDRRRRMVSTIPESNDSPTTCVAPVKRRAPSQNVVRPSPGRPQRKESICSETSHTASSSSASSYDRPPPQPTRSSSGGGGTSRQRRISAASINTKKNVHWYPKVEKKRHIMLQDMTDEEKEAVWYTEGDSKIILGLAKVTVKMMMKGECPTDDVDYCSRGLEGKTPTGAKRRQQNKFRVRKALLEEQEMQREEGICDPEYLGQVSRENSKDVCIQARHTALTDEQAIQEYLNMLPSSMFTKGKDRSPAPPSRRILR